MNKGFVALVLVASILVATNAQASFQSFMNQQAAQQQQQQQPHQQASFQSFMNQQAAQNPNAGQEQAIQAAGQGPVLDQIAKMTQVIHNLPHDVPQQQTDGSEAEMLRLGRSQWNQETGLIRRNEGRFHTVIEGNRESDLIHDGASRGRNLNRRLSRRLQASIRRQASLEEKRNPGDDTTIPRQFQRQQARLWQRYMRKFHNKQKRLSRRIERRTEERERAEEMAGLQRRWARRLSKDISRTKRQKRRNSRE
jgi:hypothetical protein